VIEQNGTSDVLSFNTLEQEGLKFKIDGETYQTVPAETYGGRQIARIKRHTKVVERFGENLQRDDYDISDEEIDEYENAVREIGRMIAPDVPDDAFMRLGDMQIQRLVGAFMGEVRGERPSESATT
jgi:hypothetical protein